MTKQRPDNNPYHGQCLIQQRPRPPIPDALSTIGSPLAEILVNRGIVDPIQINPALELLIPPSGMPGIEAAADLLAKSVQAQDRILIVGDFDADGATATALCVRALRAMGARRVDYTLPDRQRHGYGLSPALLQDWIAEADSPPDVILTVDNGTAAFAGVAAALAMGATVIITDHHLPGETLPPAHAIVNPNLEGSPFGSKAIAGVGVAFYVMAALRERLTTMGWFDSGTTRPNLAQWLDLVAVGTVADVVSLDDNNRRLVAQGLARIREQQCVPGLSALFAVAGKDSRHAASTDLGFVIGPRLNAAGRLEDMRIGVDCLLADDPVTARQYALTLNEINLERRALEQEMLSCLKKPAQESSLTQLDLPRPDNPADWVIFDKSFHQGVIGIVAGRLKERWQRPVFVFAPETSDAPTAKLKASGRSIPGVHLRDVLVSMATACPDLMHSFGGHAMAAGLSLSFEQLETFRHLFAQEMAKHQAHFPDKAIILSDGALSADELTLDFAEQIRACTPWGTDCPEPVFDNHFEVLEQIPLKGGRHWRLRLRLLQPASSTRLNTGTEVAAVWFGVGDRIPAGKYWHLAYRIDINRFRGQQTLQLMIIAGRLP